jgi:chlorobactene glucosyltransferase
MVLLLLAAAVMVLLLHVLDVRRILRTPQIGATAPPSLDAPRFSVLIPARNEAARIRPCLEGLAAQQYRLFEVIVVDDQSTDGTAEIVREYTSRLPHLTLLTGAALPDQWAGKCWACWQATAAATGEWLLFLDADVAPHPALLARLAAETGRADVITILPHIVLDSVAERAILPAFFELIGAIYPFDQVNDPGSPLAFAIGQCLMVRSSAYQAIDGHRGVRGSVLEDMDLAQRAKRSGLTLHAAEAPDLLSVRMYDGWPTIREGLAKNATAGARHGGWRAGLIGVGRLALGWLAYDLIALAWLAGAQWPLVLGIGLLLLGLGALVSGWIVQRRFRLSRWWGLALPVGTLIYFILAAWAFARLRWGKGVRWKGRAITMRR